MTGPRCVTALADASTIGKEFILWLSMPVMLTRRVGTDSRKTRASPPSIPPFAPLSMSDPREMRDVLWHETLYVSWDAAKKESGPLCKTVGITDVVWSNARVDIGTAR